MIAELANVTLCVIVVICVATLFNMAGAWLRDRRTTKRIKARLTELQQKRHLAAEHDGHGHKRLAECEICGGVVKDAAGVCMRCGMPFKARI